MTARAWVESAAFFVSAKRQRGGATQAIPSPSLTLFGRDSWFEFTTFFGTRSVSEGSWCTNVTNSLAYASGYD